MFAMKRLKFHKLYNVFVVNGDCNSLNKLFFNICFNLLFKKNLPQLIVSPEAIDWWTTYWRRIKRGFPIPVLLVGNKSNKSWLSLAYEGMHQDPAPSWNFTVRSYHMKQPQNVHQNHAQCWPGSSPISVLHGWEEKQSSHGGV